ncbi:LPXTG cell wall anchor domain-containing protein [uncultured Parolsenella sp.]
MPQTGDMLPSAGVFGGGALLAVALVGIGSWLRKRE